MNGAKENWGGFMSLVQCLNGVVGEGLVRLGPVQLSYSAVRSVRSTAAIIHKSSPLYSSGAQARGCLPVFGH